MSRSSYARPPVQRTLALVALAVLLAFSAACGGGSEEHPTSPAAGAELTATPGGPGPAKGAEVVDITFSGDSVTPLGEQLELKRGQALVLRIKADTAGDLHVHSTPQKQISYPAGSSQVSLSIDRPGVVEVESHSLDKLILQLEVR